MGNTKNLLVQSNASLQCSGVFDPRGIRQLALQARPLGSLLAGIKVDHYQFICNFRVEGQIHDNTLPIIRAVHWSIKFYKSIIPQMY